MTKKWLMVILIAGSLLNFTGCGDSSSGVDDTQEIIIFAAASMTEVMTEIADQYMAANDLTIINTFDSSGTLKTQIEEGADCDIFISASKKQMDALDGQADSDANPDGLDFVMEGSRKELLENKVVLAVPEGNPSNITGYDDLIERLQVGSILMAMGNSDVPVGQYTSKILSYYGLDEDALASSGVITYASNVKEVTTQVSEETVDCGIIYATDAKSAGLTFVDEATKEMAGQVIYPVAVMKDTQVPEAAQAFLDYLLSEESGLLLTEYGFTPLQ